LCYRLTVTRCNHSETLPDFKPLDLNTFRHTFTQGRPLQTGLPTSYGGVGSPLLPPDVAAWPNSPPWDQESDPLEHISPTQVVLGPETPAGALPTPLNALSTESSPVPVWSGVACGSDLHSKKGSILHAYGVTIKWPLCTVLGVFYSILHDAIGMHLHLRVTFR
jgi:hypothetical protein